MKSNPRTTRPMRERQFPQRVLIADIAHPDREEVELELLPGTADWGNLPTASYVLEIRTDE
jgi:hypothetical protein